MEIVKEIAPRFYDFVFDWDYETYLALGGYGSGKSYHIALKIIFKCLEEKIKVLVIREVFETLSESCYDLIKEILDDLDLLAEDYTKKYSKIKVIAKKSPLEFIFPNGSRIIFKGMDKPNKLKSLNGINVVWLEECSEVKYEGYKEILGRLRNPNTTMAFILSCNPVGKENWVYRHFFVKLSDSGEETIIVNDEELYNKKTLVHNNIYMHHSLPEDNPYLPKSYLRRLDAIKSYDPTLYRIARLGMFGAAGLRVLPQFEIANDIQEFKNAIYSIPDSLHKIGMDFGFEESYNAVISMAVDIKKGILYIYDEIYVNKITDDKMALHPKMLKIKNENKEIIADNEDPKAIQYYRQCGYKIRPCKNKFAGSRLSNTRKIKRFKKIICSPKCTNTIRELKDLTYKKDSKGNIVYDEFNIDPHTKPKTLLVCINWCKKLGACNGNQSGSRYTIIVIYTHND